MPASTGPASRGQLATSTGPRRATIRIATRRSPLALVQAELVRSLLADRGVESVLVEVSTTGDHRLDIPIDALGSSGVFVREVEAALFEGRADVAVHSAKDLPATTDPGLVLGAVPVRADPRDVLFGCSLGDLAPGATVATGAPRRRAQLAWLRPDLHFVPLRGNVGTRLTRCPPGGALVVAKAALDRLGVVDPPGEVLPTSVLLPQAGQAALALECRADDPATVSLLETLDDGAIHRAVAAERAFLAALGAGCQAPVGALGLPVDGGALSLEGVVARRDGGALLRRSAVGSAEAASELGRHVAALLVADGAAELLASRSPADGSVPDGTVRDGTVPDGSVPDDPRTGSGSWGTMPATHQA